MPAALPCHNRVYRGSRELASLCPVTTSRVLAVRRDGTNATQQKQAPMHKYGREAYRVVCGVVNTMDQKVSDYDGLARSLEGH